MLNERTDVLARPTAERNQVLVTAFRSHFKRLHGLAFVILGDAALAEEVVMDAFVKAFAKWARFRQAENLEAYLRQTVVNLCRSRIRRKAIELREAAKLRAESTGDSAWDHDEISERVQLSLERLPQRQRACVALRYLEDQSEAQVAEILGCSQGTVKSQLARARVRLAEALEQPPGGRR